MALSAAAYADEAEAVATVTGSAVSDPVESGGARYFYRVDAHGASGTEPAMGAFSFGCESASPGACGSVATVTVDVTCVRVVDGNRAIIGYLTRRSPYSGNQILPGILVVEDYGAPEPDGVLKTQVGFDEVGSEGDTPITDCPSDAPPDINPSGFYWNPFAVLYGDIVVDHGLRPLVRCGQRITTNTALPADLTCNFPAQTALFIGAPGITLDLGGHTVYGQNTITNEGHDEVTIQNGRLLDDGSQGMLLSGVTGNIVRNISASGLLGGIHLVDSDDNRVVDNRVHSVFLGIRGGSDRNVIARNVATGYESGISIRNSHDNRVVDNISWTTEDAPLSLFQAHRNVVRGNTLVSGFAYSEPLLRLTGANDNRLVENTIVTYGTYRGSGIGLEGSNQNLIRLNEVTGAPLGIHIRSGIGNELRRNVANGAPAGEFDGPRDGFLVGGAAQQTLVLRNSASRFDQSGFALFGAETAAGGNSATDNGAFGIDAILGTIDLGGNTASGNDAYAQCRNITCG